MRARDRHADYYATALQAWGEDMNGRRQRAVLAEMDAEIANVWAAWDWAARGCCVDQLSRAESALATYCERQSQTRQGETAFRRAYARLVEERQLEPGAPAETLRTAAMILADQAMCLHDIGPSQAALDLVQEGLDLLRRPELEDCDTRLEQAILWFRMGSTQQSLGQEEFRRSFERSLHLARAAGDQAWTAAALALLAHVDQVAGHYAGARAKWEECVAIARQGGDERQIAVAVGWLALVHVQEGHVNEGVRLAREAYGQLGRIGPSGQRAFGAMLLATALAYAGEYAESQLLLEERCRIGSELGWHDHFAAAMAAWVDLQQGKYEPARLRLSSAAVDALSERGVLTQALVRLELGRLALRDGDHASARRLLLKSVRGLQAFGATDFAPRALAACSVAERGLGDFKEARKYLVRTLRYALDRGSTMAVVEVLPPAALLLLDQDEEFAIEVYELALTFPYVASSQWHEDVVGTPVARACAGLPESAVTAARARGRAREVDATLRELLARWEEQRQRVDCGTLDAAPGHRDAERAEMRA
jgi:tetratricopeptide (TPR) repeat protein